MRYSILITGGAGFIGSHLCEKLISEGHKVSILDNLSTGSTENISDMLGEVELFNEDILSFDSNILKDIDIIFHLAAQINIRTSNKDPIFDLNTNVNGTINLLENIIKSDANIKKIIYSSSIMVYGNPIYLPVDEKHPTDPISPYSASKLAAEKYIQVYHENYGLNYVNLRYGNVFGERQNPDGEVGVISIFLDRILNNEPISIWGDGEDTRDFISVHDVIESNIFALNKLENDTFNVGSGKETSVNELIDIFSKILNKKIDVEHTDRTKGQIRNIYMDISKIKKYGFEPKVDLMSGIKNLIYVGLTQDKHEFLDF